MNWTVVAAMLALTLTACSSTGSGSGSTLQAFTGTGGNANRPLATSIVEAMAGGLVGGPLGAGLDQGDRRRALEAEYRALEYTAAGEAVAWGEAADRRRGEVVAGSPYRVGSQDCRQYSHTVHVSGRSQSARGTACRNPDGSWTPLV